MNINRSWSALLIGILVTSVIVIIALYLLDKIVPFSRDTKGIENGTISYYRANTALNEALLSMSGGNPGYETGSSSVANGSGVVYKVTAMGQILPQSGQWDSEYDKNWSILAPGKPIQLKLPSGIAWTNPADVHFNFRVPDLNKDGSWSDQTLTGTGMIINWILSASGESLVASSSQITANGVNGADIGFNGRDGLTVSGSSVKFEVFYWNKCSVSNACTLKISLINPLLLQDGTTVAPYLEYQAHFNTSVPLQTAVIETQGYAGGFRKNITRFIQQTTTNEALDFTVFQ